MNVSCQGLLTYYVSHIWRGLHPPSPICQQCQHLDDRPTSVLSACQHLARPPLQAIGICLAKKAQHMLYVLQGTHQDIGWSPLCGILFIVFYVCIRGSPIALVRYHN